MRAARLLAGAQGSERRCFAPEFWRDQRAKRLLEGAAVEQAGEVVAIAIVVDPEMIAINAQQPEHQPLLVLAHRRVAQNFDEADDAVTIGDRKDMAMKAADAGPRAKMAFGLVAGLQRRFAVERFDIVAGQRATRHLAMLAARRTERHATTHANVAVSRRDAPCGQQPRPCQFEHHRGHRIFERVAVAHAGEAGDLVDKPGHFFHRIHLETPF
jgi:hypothetical protein